jgi:hypothetical protein
VIADDHELGFEVDDQFEAVLLEAIAARSLRRPSSMSFRVAIDDQALPG